MTDALDSVAEPQAMPITMRGAFILQVRASRRTHVFVPATYIPGARGPGKGKARPIATPYVGLKPHDRLWVREESAALIDLKGQGSKAFYRIELTGGHVPIPGTYRRERWRTKIIAAKDLKREDSRYTLEVTAAEPMRAWEVSWNDMEREGTFDAHTGKNAWWERWYGLMMPWRDNPEVVGVDFTFTDGNIDSGQRWVPEEKPKTDTHRYLARVAAPAEGCPHRQCLTPGECRDACKLAPAPEAEHGG